MDGFSITTNTDRAAAASSSVHGVVADGITRVLVRIPAAQQGQTLNVAVLNDSNPPAVSSSTDNDGGLVPLGGNPDDPSSTLTVSAVNTSQGPMAFLIYRGPANFSRGGTTNDNNLESRGVTLQVTDPSTNQSSSIPVIVRRPPVLVVHGLWADPSAWDKFSPLINNGKNDPRFFIERADYTQFVNVTSTVPVYQGLNNGVFIQANSMGLDYNAPGVASSIRKAINHFNTKNNIAGVQADIVAHSLGGVVVRNVGAGSTFRSSDTYGAGTIHKLITIGTPHLGSPLAAMLLRAQNQCLAQFLAAHGLAALETVTLKTGQAVNGAVIDVEGDGAGGGLSQTIQKIRAALPLQVATIAGFATQGNMASLDCKNASLGSCTSGYIRALCSTSPLAQAFNSPQASSTTNWPLVAFNNQANDTVVPTTSQMNNASGSLLFSNVVHSPGMVQLTFTGPTEMDLAAISNKVIDLLNEKIPGPDFSFQ